MVICARKMATSNIYNIITGVIKVRYTSWKEETRRRLSHSIGKETFFVQHERLDELMVGIINTSDE